MLAQDNILVEIFISDIDYNVEINQYIELLTKIRDNWENNENLTINERAKYCKLERALMKRYLRAFIKQRK